MLGTVINSKNKKNLEFAAMGSYQIEFFGVDNVEYFVIYRFTGNSGRMKIMKFSQLQVTQESSNCFQMVAGVSSFEIRLKEEIKCRKMVFTQHLWGWLPIRIYSGRVSENGWSIVVNNLKKHVESENN